MKAPAFALALGCAMAAAPNAQSGGLPVPSFFYFGEVKDAFGWPLLAEDAAQIVVHRLDGQECGRALVHEGLGPTLNYRVELAMAAPDGTLYAPYAVRQGDRITMVLETGGNRYPVTMPASLAPVGEPGSQVRQDIALGVDSDNDGLPDAWEEWLIEGAGTQFSSISQVRPMDDFDKDGVNNRDEYLAGTDPAWSDDRPLVEAIHYDKDRALVAIAILTVPGRTYRVLGSGNDGVSTLNEPQPVAFDANTEPTATYWKGDGQLTWVHLQAPTDGASFLQIEIR
jgi:hypothetical protein